MKKIVLMCVIIMTFVFAVQAQNMQSTTAVNTKAKMQTSAQKAQAAVDKLDKTVMLTPDQKGQVKNLAITKFNAIDATKAKYKGQNDKMDMEKKDIQAAKDAYHMGLKRVLTPEQYQKFEASEKMDNSNNSNMNKW